MAEELWQAVAQTGESISYVTWPTYDESKLVEAEVEIVVQIKGKVRAKLVVTKDLSPEELQEIALSDEKIKSEIADKEVVKVISVPNKLVNIGCEIISLFIAFAGDFNQVLIRQQNAIAINYKVRP